MPERRDGDRIIVTGYSGGSHFPRTQAATQYKFEADGMAGGSPYHIDGSVYGRDARFRGPGSVLGPVLGRGDVQLVNHSQAPQRFLGGIHANGNVVSMSRGAKLEDSLTATLESADHIVRGDVIGEHVSLENALVFGNVRGRQVSLTSCIVFGHVLAREAARIAATTFAAYEAPAVRLEGPCCTLFALGVSETAPAFGPFQDGAGKAWPADVRYYPVFRGRDTHALSNRPWETHGEAWQQSALFPSDWLRVDAERRDTHLRDGKEVVEVTPVQRFVLTVAGRALNFQAIAGHLERLTWMLKTVLEFEHYHPNTRQQIRRRWEDACTAEEKRVMELLTTVPQPPQAPAPAPRSAVAPAAAR